MVMMVSVTSSSRPPPNDLRFNADGSAVNPGAFQQHVRQNSQMMAQLLQIGHLFYHCSFTVLDASNMEFLFGLDMLRKHQCIIDLKENVLRVGGGEVSVSFLQEKDIPAHIRDEARLAQQSSLGQGSAPDTLGAGDKTTKTATSAQSSGTLQSNRLEGADMEAKITKLVELGFDREAALQALRLFNGNEERAAGYLFGG